MGCQGAQQADWRELAVRRGGQWHGTGGRRHQLQAQPRNQRSNVVLPSSCVRSVAKLQQKTRAHVLQVYLRSLSLSPSSCVLKNKCVALYL
jgi:hypothetical protein